MTIQTRKADCCWNCKHGHEEFSCDYPDCLYCELEKIVDYPHRRDYVKSRFGSDEYDREVDKYVKVREKYINSCSKVEYSDICDNFEMK